MGGDFDATDVASRAPWAVTRGIRMYSDPSGYPLRASLCVWLKSLQTWENGGHTSPTTARDRGLDQTKSVLRWTWFMTG